MKGIIVPGLLVIFTLSLVATSGCINIRDDIPDNPSFVAAREFVLNSPTYKFDGSGLKLLNAEIENCQKCYEYMFEFQSSHSGYGDRTGQVLAQVITRHQARISVEKEEIVSAVLDEDWDMINQINLIPENPVVDPNDPTSGSGLANPASVYCVDQGGELILTATPEGQAGFCEFDDGRFCEEWGFYRSEGQICNPPE